MKSDLLGKIVDGVKKVDKTKLMAVAGFGLAMLANSLSGKAQKQERDETIRKEVEKALQGKCLMEIAENTNEGGQ